MHKAAMAPSDATDFAARRRYTPEEVLTAESMRWLDQLPLTVRPQHLPKKFPRITNGLSRHWRAPRACLAYLDDLLIDKRGNRRGFPLEILIELASLKSHFQTAVHRAPQTLWGEILIRSRER